MATYAIGNTHGSDRATATVLRIPPQAETPRELDYTVHISSHEAGEPVITLVLAHED